MDSGFTKLRGKARLLTTLTGGVSPFGFSATADGRQIVFLRGEPQWDVYIGELDQGGKHFHTTPTRLTLDDHNDLATGWSLDSRAVLFSSDRNGSFDIFRQFIDQQIAQPLVANPPDEMAAFPAPDGASYYYLVMPDGWKATQYRALRWMQVPVTGGSSRPVFDAPVPGEIYCSLPPSNVCVLPEHDGNDMVVYAVDPGKGKGREKQWDKSHWVSHSWELRAFARRLPAGDHFGRSHSNPYSQTERDWQRRIPGYFRSWLEPFPFGELVTG